MIPPVDTLNRAFDNRVRLAIMSILAVRDETEFNTLKQLLQVTDGNLATHVAVLERHRYIRVRKSFRGKKPRTAYAVTESGRKAFAEHVAALERIIRGGV
ncbi:MAG TPA: transcriptional regulator [Bacteroidota bacterium]|nr:transcriptional regulator [Bacteroidota bacterium]